MRRILVAAVFLFLACSIPGQQQETRLRVDVRLVLLNTLVNQPTGAPARDLRIEDFRVLEDGKAQPITVFATGAMPVYVALVMDTSGSTRDSLPELKRAARDFAEQFGLEDQLALYDFGPDVMRLQPFSTDRRNLRRALDKLQPITSTRDLERRRQRAPVLAEAKPPGGSMVYDCLAIVAGEFPAEAQRRVILVFTDALDNASQRTLEELSRSLLGGSTVVYAVMPQGSLTWRRWLAAPNASQRAKKTYAKAKWALILDFSQESLPNLTAIRETAGKFLGALDPEARVWVSEYSEGQLRLLIPPDTPAQVDSKGVPLPLTPLEAMDALQRGISHPRFNGTGEGEATRVLADWVLVLTDAKQSGVSRLYRAGLLRAWYQVILSPETFAGEAQQEMVLQALMEEPAGAALLAAWLNNEALQQKFRDLVPDTGGAVLEARRAKDLKDSYAQIAQLIRSSYTLGYYTKAKPGRHELRVETPGKNLTVRSRRVVVLEK